MIQANELRIGNYVRQYDYDFYEDDKFKANTFNDVQVGLYTIDLIHKKDEFTFIEPIPLTGEILLKCGFDGNINLGFGNDAIELNYITTDNHFQFEYGLPGTNKVIWLLTQVKYLHQLQNLYFALTNQELQVNL